VPEIPLRNRAGDVIARTVVDEADFATLGGLRWYRHQSAKQAYAARKVVVNGTRVRWFLHRAILGLDPSDRRRVDHVNGDTLDNRRANLRVATTAQNAQNQGSRGGSSRYRGVTWDKSRQMWLAHAQLDGRKVTIGRFASEDDAGEAAAAWRREHMAYAGDVA
jgi:hypothetical protein